MNWIALIGPILQELLQIAGSATTGQVSNIINMLDKFIAIAVDAAPNLLSPISNIIAALRGNGTVTPEQIAALQVQSATVDAAMDAVAKDDGLV